MFVLSRSVSRVPQATLVLLLFTSSLLPLITGANAAPTTVPSPPTTVTSQLDERAQGPKHRSGLPVPVLLVIVAASLTVLLLGATLAFMYVRRLRMHQKRTEHRERTWQFQEQHRSRAHPYSSAPAVPLPKSVPLDEKIMGPRYPIKAYVM